jgi:hypothetical protein
VYTSPNVPEAPKAPIILEISLHTMLFEWEVPYDNGSAITGYRIFIQHLDREIDLPRTQNTYLLEGLDPGKCKIILVDEEADVLFHRYCVYDQG